jgi:hypothetical protein
MYTYVHDDDDVMIIYTCILCIMLSDRYTTEWELGSSKKFFKNFFTKSKKPSNRYNTAVVGDGSLRIFISGTLDS